MRIAILVWGSLYWDPRDLNTTGEWFFDGPILPVEFSRISVGNRLTLVIDSDFDNVTTLYAISGLADLTAAIENLRMREGAPSNANIGFINLRNGENHVRQTNQFVLQILRDWNETKGFDAIIWSDFTPKFSDVINRPFNLQNAIEFIEELNPNSREAALQYINNAPEQITTRFRKQIIDHFSNLH